MCQIRKSTQSDASGPLAGDYNNVTTKPMIPHTRAGIIIRQLSMVEVLVNYLSLSLIV